MESVYRRSHQRTASGLFLRALEIRGGHWFEPPSESDCDCYHCPRSHTVNGYVRDGTEDARPSRRYLDSHVPKLIVQLCRARLDHERAVTPEYWIVLHAVSAMRRNASA